jgi:hypothetical protein
MLCGVKPASSVGNSPDAHSALGIDTPKSSRPYEGEDSLQYRCGALRMILKPFLPQRAVKCMPISLDRYWPTVVACSPTASIPDCPSANRIQPASAGAILPVTSRI